MNCILEIRTYKNDPYSNGLYITKISRIMYFHPWYNQQVKHLHTFLGETPNINQIEMLKRASTEQLRLELGLL